VAFIRLRELFGLPGDRPARESVIVVEYGEHALGLVVDRLVGASQTVIKPLGPLFRNTKGLGGSTILGSGEVALILDVPQLLSLAESTRASRAA
jgi:two-component system chemotaxis sensor kinase CheA